MHSLLLGIGKPRDGVTLIELVGVLAIIGTVALLTGLAMQRAAPTPGVAGTMSIIKAGRRDALRFRRPVQIRIEIDGRPHILTALPDGRVLGAGIAADSVSLMEAQ